MIHNLLRNALILDTETLDLHRGSGMHQLALFNPVTRSARQFNFSGNRVQVQNAIQQDLAGMVSSPLDRARLVTGIQWPEAIRQHLSQRLGRTVATHETSGLIPTEMPFLQSMLNKGAYPHLTGQHLTAAQLTARQQNLDILGRVFLTEHHNVDINQFVMQDLQHLIRGKTVWIQNAGFESKQIGAVVQAQHQIGLPNTLKSVLETSSDSPDPFYVTGVEVNRARVKAQLTGDWRGVWHAYNAHPPATGETAVRDIMDVSKAFHSYGRSLGLTTSQNQNFGQSIDIQSRLFGSLEQDPTLRAKMVGLAESHTAVEDAAIHESYTLEKLLHYTGALQAVEEGTPEGLAHIAAAKQGTGPLYEAAQYFHRLHGELAPDILKLNLLKRFDRAQQDLATTGVSVQTAGISRVSSMKQTLFNGTTSKVPYVQHDRVNLTDIAQVADHLEGTHYSEFGVSPRTVLAEMQDAGSVQTLIETVQSRISTQLQSDAAHPTRLMGAIEDIGSKLGQKDANAALETLSASRIPALGLAAGASLIAMGLFANYRHAEMQPNATPFTAFQYQDWANHQVPEGMSTGPVAQEGRHSITDFGSPYIGPIGSNQVFADQELLAERERWLRQRYNAVHYDPQSGLLGVFSPFHRLQYGRGGYGFLNTPDAQAVNGKQYGLRGNLLQLDMSSGNWKMEATDADTVTVKRGGIRGAITDFFGMNRSYSFRMAGIDAPETSHGDMSYHAPQPQGEASTVAFQQMLASSKDLKLFYDPQQTTYGRMMGAVVGDGKNLNFELVKRGLAAHLPYGKTSDSIIDYSKLKTMESQAYSVNRGMWANPWEQVYKTATDAAGSRITFNTFTKKDKLVGNQGEVSLLGLMEQAQAAGMTSNETIIEATRIGKGLKQDRMKPDYAMPFSIEGHPPQYSGYLDQMIQDSARFTSQHGTNLPAGRFSRRSGYGKYEHYMAIDSMGSTNSSWNQPNLAATELYNVSYEEAQQRKARMAAAQRQVSQTMMTNTGIGHTRY